MSRRASKRLWPAPRTLAAQHAQTRYATRPARIFVAALAAALGGCASYHAKPLPNEPNLSASLSSLAVSANRLDLPGLKPEAFDPAQPLGETVVITLAVLNNPKLKAARLQAGVADAQLLEAGLIPDLRLAAGVSRSALFRGYDASLTEDMRALVTHRAAKAAAAAHQRQVNLQVLWQEWQVAQRARALFITATADEQLRKVLDRRRKLLGTLYDRDRKALEQHNVTASAVTADFASLSAAAKQWRALQLERNRTRHALDELLGLEPTVSLRLEPTPESRLLPADRFRAAVAALPHRRPDLLALEAGYQSQEEQLRRAILARFPVMSAGVQRTRGAEEGIAARGLTVSLTLPFFNRNRGAIAVQRASRELLYETYQARLDEAANEADQIWSAARIMQSQLRSMKARLPALRRAAAAARRSVASGNLALGDAVRVESDVLGAQADVVRLHESLQKAESTLATLLALPF